MFKLLSIKLIKFIIILFIIDFTLGFAAKQLYFNQETGKQARISYSINEASSEIFIFGSSHANRHYVPDIFKNELNLSCYNAGVQGQKIIFHSVLEKIILRRTKPRIVILNIDKNWLYNSSEAYDRLHDLYPYYWEFHDIIKPVLQLKSKLIDFQLFFKSYQTNSTIVHIIKYFIFPQKDYSGYRPLYGKIKRPNNIDNNISNSNPTTTYLDANFILALNSFIKTAKNNNVDLFFVTSPNLNETDYSKNKSFNKIKEIAIRENIGFFDFYNDKKFIRKYELFNDASHLNDDGAHLFSKRVAILIKTYKRTIE